jgi:hypothetical protein
MGYWLVLGLLLAGCGIGALLTAAVFLSQLRKVKTDLQTASFTSQSQSQVAPDLKPEENHRRSA